MLDKVEVYITYNEPVHVAGCKDYVVHFFNPVEAQGYIEGVRMMATHMTHTVTIKLNGKEM